MNYIEGHYYLGEYNNQKFIFMCIGGASSNKDEKQFVIAGSPRVFKLSEIRIIKEIKI